MKKVLLVLVALAVITVSCKKAEATAETPVTDTTTVQVDSAAVDTTAVDTVAVK